MGNGIQVLPGSPSTLLIPSSDGYYVIDPGSSEERKAEIEAQGKIKAVMITHSHSDHILAARGLRSELGIFAPLSETPFIESPELREATTFGGYAPWNLIFHVEAVPLEVNNPFRLPFSLDEIEAIPLPGHTFGQVGYVARGILYAADSFFGDKLIRSVVIPYFLDFETAMRTIESLRDNARDFEKIVPSHGPIVEGKRAVELLEMNVRAMESMRERVISILRGRKMSVEALSAKILREGGAELTPGSIILSSVTIRSLLSRLYERGIVDAEAGEEGILWKLNG